MNEPETNPQRHETPGTASGTGEPSHRTADGPREPDGPVPGRSDGSPDAEPTVVQPAYAPSAASAPPGTPPADDSPAWSRTGDQAAWVPPGEQAGWSQSGDRTSWTGAGSSWGAPGGWRAPDEQPPPAYAGPADAGHGAAAPPWAPAGQQPGPHPGPQPGPHPGPQPGPHPGQHPGPHPGAQPAWAAPVGAPPGPDPHRARRRRQVLAGGAAALLIALAGGGVGAAVTHALDSGDGATTVRTANSSVTRVVDRSSLAQIAAAVQDSVVSITTGSGEGSGVVITAEGFVLTNNHVVATAQGGTVNVVFANGKKSTARIVGTDPRTDLAVVRVEGASGLKAAVKGDSAKMEVGDTVLALGSPLGLEGSVTAGIISAKDRTIQAGGEDQRSPQQGTATTQSGLLQTDAPINPGNSGGALVNTNGEVIGINSAIYTSGQNAGNIGLGFAIPSNKAWQVAEDLIAGRKVSHPALGVSVTEAEGGGALVSTVTPGSAAARAGLQQGDVVTQVNGAAVNDSDDLVGIVQGAKVGDRVTVTYKRNGVPATATATLAEAS